ncbi:DinB family protein [Fodinibius sediminis]|uniref:DinB superfamily protein n=1 Tax=Fodinibius sediminis TaxID=1214077 RepID=A0A521BHT6_9BACT|nr:DinB family protein [Fodinibius sediminis]SMO46270.1 DinB superfamily protein [Fodinibius sediminis]
MHPDLSLQQIEKQLALVFEGDPWYGPSMRSILTSLDTRFLFKTPAAGVHSIAELLAHILAWRRFAEQQLRGQTGELPEQEETFDWSRFCTDAQKVWPVMLDELRSNQRSLLALLRQYDDTILDQRVHGKPYSYRYLLTGIIQHDLYHFGQIAYIQKILTPEKDRKPVPGLLTYSYRVFPFENLSLLK